MRYTIILLILLAGCKSPIVISDFCRQIETIGYSRMLTKFSDAELKAINLDRKRALLALRRAYDANCTNPPN
jgi:hypothetical protein